MALTLFELLASQGKQDYVVIYNHRYRQVREAKVQWVADTNRTIDVLVDGYFQVINQFVLTKTKRLRSPGEAA